jgi:predicted component of type VI protein secretion system
LGSAEGTFVNDSKISAEVELKPKDKVKVGPLLFEVKIEAAAPAAKPAVAAPAAKPAVTAPAAKPAVVAPAAKLVEKVEPKKSSGDDDDLDDLLFDDDDKAPSGTKPSWKDAIPEAGAEKDAGGSASEGGAKPEEKPKPAANTSDAAAALFAKFRLKK